jgi:hypothetical protein
MEQSSAIVSRSEFVVQDNRKAALLGVGLDNKDGHVRVTRGKNFHLLGGSQETHEAMQETCIKLNEKLDARGKELGSLERGEFLDLAAECGMRHVR